MHVSGNGEQFSIEYFTKRGGAWKRRMHYHDFYELEFILDGSARTTINSMDFELSRGMLLLIRPTDLHCYHIEPGKTLRVCTVRFLSTMLDGELLRRLTGVNPLIGKLCDEYDFVCRYLEEINREFLSQDHSSRLIFAGAVQWLCIMLCRKVNSQPLCPVGCSRIAAAAADRINRSFFERLTVRGVANELGVSPNHLGKVFSEQMGIGFLEYLRRVRLIYALNRIISTNDTLKRIALESGFSSASIFTREFKNYYKRSPSELREAGLEK